MRRIIVVGVIITTLAVGCGDGGSRLLSIGELDDGATVNLAVGDSLEVTLPANPSTGLTWELAGDRGCVEQRGEARYTALDDLLGSGGLLTFDLEAIQAGTEDLSFVYRRPWEDAAPERTFAVTVVVEG